ncbi:MAG: GNAT family N-acetyltransferase [Candidatus Omnitrophica bacterium]|nr:GNAT family N-acetyltransferase [Candidatus Omnitrophota bacterium]
MIKKLDWDSKHYGFNIAQIDSARLKGDRDSIDIFARKQNIEVVQVYCNTSDVKTTTMLEDGGFHFVGLDITLILDLKNDAYEDHHYLLAVKEDIPRLKEIAETVFTIHRFQDRKFDQKKVSEMYKIWTEKSVCGQFDDFCLKMTNAEDIVGFTTVKIIDTNSAQIGLFGIDVPYQGQSFGSTLMDSLMSFLNERNIKKVIVRTSGNNTRALSFYLSCGFMINTINSWYYKLYSYESLSYTIQ